MAGVSIVPTPDKKDVFAIYSTYKVQTEGNIYELKVKNGGFIWEECAMKTKFGRSSSVALQL